MEIEVKSGELDRPISIERGTITTSDLGTQVATWSSIGTVWAKFTPIADSEKFAGGELAASADCRFLIRHGMGVTPRDRIIFEGYIYSIVGVKEVGRKLGQEITARSRAE